MGPSAVAQRYCDFGDPKAQLLMQPRSLWPSRVTAGWVSAVPFGALQRFLIRLR